MNLPDWPRLLPHLRLLGYTGLIPFAGLALGAWLLVDPGWRALCLTLLRAYGVAIVSFVGAISWGAALFATAPTTATRNRLLYWSVLPSLVGFASFAMPATAACLTLAATAAAALLVDLRNAAILALPPAWRTLRVHLTLGAIASLTLGAHAARLAA